jgi:hypothetical protein
MATTPNHTRDAYVRINNWAFPMKAHEGEEELEPGSEVITNALEGFAPSTVAGESGVVDQQSVAVLVFSDWQAGQGFKFSDEAENIGGYAYGNLNTLYPNMAVLPPKWVSLGDLPATWSMNGYSRIFYSQVHAEQLYLFNLRVYTEFAVRPSSGTWIKRNLPSPGTAIYGAVEYRGSLIMVIEGAILSSPNPATTAFTAGWVGNFRGPVVHDNKIYVLNLNDGKMYWTSSLATATGVAAWTNASTAIMLWDSPSESIYELYEFINRTNTPVIHIVTSSRIVAYDDDDFFANFYKTTGYNSSARFTWATVWEQDRQVYRATSNHGGTSVLALTDETISNVTPTKRGGLPIERRPGIHNLTSSLNYLYALGTGPSPENYIGNVATAPVHEYPAGYILAWNGEGWHVVIEGRNGSQAGTPPLNPPYSILLGSGYAPNQVFWLEYKTDNATYITNTVFTAYLPEFGSLPYEVDLRQYDEGTFFMRSALIDAGHENLYKTARHMTVLFERQNGMPGIPVNHTAELWASWDGGAWGQVGATMTSTDTFPKRFPLPGTGNANDPSQVGIVWRSMQWEIRITKNVGADPFVTPIFRGLGLGYVLSPDVYLGFQFVIDLTKERFSQFKGGLFAGKSRRQLRDALYDMTQGAGAKHHYRVEWGWADDYDSVLNVGHREGIIRAAELRLNARENPGTGFGEYTVTGKDVSVKSLNAFVAAEG